MAIFKKMLIDWIRENWKRIDGFCGKIFYINPDDEKDYTSEAEIESYKRKIETFITGGI